MVFVLSLTGEEIAPYLPTLMETMLSALHNAEELKIKELAVSAIGAIGPFPEGSMGFMVVFILESIFLQESVLQRGNRSYNG